jgi:hypothetical protein
MLPDQRLRLPEKMLSGRQQATVDHALIHEASGAIFSECFMVPFDRLRSGVISEIGKST